jgi:carboxymethylenebutenolidase
MGGPLVFRTAAAVPSRVGAVASFHGGGLVTDKPDSPHLSIEKSRASYLVAIAENDDQKQPDAKTTLTAAFAAAKRTAKVEVFGGAKHGWCPPDSRVYDHALAERAHQELLELLRSVTGVGA